MHHVERVVGMHELVRPICLALPFRVLYGHTKRNNITPAQASSGEAFPETVPTIPQYPAAFPQIEMRRIKPRHDLV